MIYTRFIVCKVRSRGFFWEHEGFRRLHVVGKDSKNSVMVRQPDLVFNSEMHERALGVYGGQRQIRDPESDRERIQQMLTSIAI